MTPKPTTEQPASFGAGTDKTLTSEERIEQLQDKITTCQLQLKLIEEYRDELVEEKAHYLEILALNNLILRTQKTELLYTYEMLTLQKDSLVKLKKNNGYTQH